MEHGENPTQQPVFRSAGDDDASDSDGCTSDFAETTSSDKQLQRKRPRSTARVLRSAGYHSSTAIGLQLKWRRVGYTTVKMTSRCVKKRTHRV